MTRAARDWIAFGLRIRSAIAIPGAMPALAADPDIVISFGAEELGPVSRAEGPYRVGKAGFEFAMPGVARYLCLGGDHMLIDPDPGASEDDVAAMLIATALPALLWSRGDIVLHAAAFLPTSSDLAVAVAGPSGAGKSTVLADAIAQGARTIADDSVRLYRVGDAVIASGLPGGWFGPLDGDAPRDFTPVPAEAQLPGHRLGRLLVLTRDVDAPQRLAGVDAIHALLANRHRPRIARLMRREAAMLADLAAICRLLVIHSVPSRSDNFLATPGRF